MTERATAGSPHPKPDPVAAVLADLWGRRRGEVLADLDVLHTLLMDLAGSPHDEAVRVEAAAVTHRLHGAVGVFGFEVVAGQLAELEIRLGDGSPADAAMVDTVLTVIRHLAE